MAEIARLNLSSPVYDPSRGVQQVDERDRIRQERADALNNAIKAYQVKGAQYQMKEHQTKLRADRYLGQNMSKFKNTSADVLDPSSWKFTNPEHREELFQDWKKNVGGNYMAFNELYNKAKALESQSMAQRMIIDASNPRYRTKDDYKNHFSELLDEMPEEQRDKIFASIPPELYQQVMGIYKTPDERAGFEFADIDDMLLGSGMVESRESAETLRKTILGMTAVGITALLLKKGFPKNLIDKIIRRAKPITDKSRLLPERGTYAPASARGASSSPGSVVPPNKIAQTISELQKAYGHGRITKEELRAAMKAIRESRDKTGTIAGDIVEKALNKSGSGKSLLSKIKSKTVKFGIPLAGAATFGAIGSTVGSVAGDKGEGVGGVLGGSYGMLASNRLFSSLKRAVDSKGWSWVLKKVVSKGGPGLAARTLGKAGIGGLTGLFSGGAGIAFGLAWAAADIYLILNILNEAEQEGEFA